MVVVVVGVGPVTGQGSRCIISDLGSPHCIPLLSLSLSLSLAWQQDRPGGREGAGRETGKEGRREGGREGRREVVRC